MRNASNRPAIYRAVIESLEQRRLLTLAAPAAYAVGDNPQAVATADLNGDGRSDVVTADAYANPNTISVLLANPDGTLAPAQHFPSGAGTGTPRSVAIGDVNGDGKRDILAINGTGVSVLLGNGNGTFGAPAAVTLPGQFPPGYTGAEPVPQWPISTVAVGDVNADGKLDLVVGAYTVHNENRYGYNYEVVTPYVNVLIGNGNGTFAAATANRQSERSVAPITLADFNNDNKLDVLAGNLNASLWLGNGNGSLAAPILTGVSGSTAVGDFDRDGKLDIAAGSGASVTIFKGSGAGTFQNVRTLSVGTAGPNGGGVGGSVRSTVAGDVDSDGKLDLVVNTQRTVFESYGYYGGYSPTTTDYTKVLLGFGDAQFSLPITSTLRSYPERESGPNATALGDVNADGRADVIATESTLDTATVQLNQGGWLAPVGVSINDLTVTEGSSGTVDAVLTVTLDHAAPFAVSVPYATADGVGDNAATVAGGDYFAASGTLNFAAGQTSKTITVQVRGDRRGEPNETFFVNLGEAANTSPIDAQGVVTITDDEPRLTLSTNTSVTEGNSGTTTLNVTATLSTASDAPATFTYATQANSATSGTDFVAATGTVTFAPGQTSRPITLTVLGDTIPEYAEIVDVVPSSVANALWDGNKGYGFIVDDDPGAAVAISNLSRAEGNSGTTPFTFTVTRLTPSERQTFVYYNTANGSASSSGGNADYTPITSDSVNFAPGQVNTTLTVMVKGDTRNESDETFFVNLTGSSDGPIADAQGVGTILNDESRGKTWVGPASGGSWSTASNWSPSGVPTATSLVTISGASVTLASSATVAALSLNGAAQLSIAPNGNRVLRTGGLFLDYSQGGDVGMLNLNDNDLIVDYAGGAGTVSPIGAWNPTGFGIGGTGAPGWYDGILGSVANARNNGGWNLWGVTTSRPDALAGRTTLAVAEASQVLGLSGAQAGLFDGQTVDATTVLVKYTFAGDANLDGKINVDDYGRIDVNVTLPGVSGWFNGDFNYDGKINVDDYGIIDFNVTTQTTPLRATPASGFTMVQRPPHRREEDLFASTSAGDLVAWSVGGTL